MAGFCAGLEGKESGLVWLRRHALFCAAKKCYLQTNKTRLKKKDVQTRVSAVVNIGVLWIQSSRDNSRSVMFQLLLKNEQKNEFDLRTTRIRTHSLKYPRNPCQLYLGNPCQFDACSETKQEEMLRNTYNPKTSNAKRRIRFDSKLERRRVRSQASYVTDAVPCYLAARCL